MKTPPEEAFHVEPSIPKSGASLNRHRSRQDYSTPADFITAVVQRFGLIAWDLAASIGDHVGPPLCFFDEGMNSLSRPWRGIRGTLWLNPPFSNIKPWAEKCALESACGARILLLVPASVDSEWFANYVHRHALVLAVRPRLCFDGKDPFPKGCILAAYGWGVGFDTWLWKPRATHGKLRCDCDPSLSHKSCKSVHSPQPLTTTVT